MSPQLLGSVKTVAAILLYAALCVSSVTPVVAQPVPQSQGGQDRNPSTSARQQDGRSSQRPPPATPPGTSSQSGGVPVLTEDQKRCRERNSCSMLGSCAACP